MNIWKFIYFNCGEWSEDTIDQRTQSRVEPGRETTELSRLHSFVRLNRQATQAKAVVILKLQKIFRPEWDSNPWPLQYWCSALQTELWAIILHSSHIWTLIYSPAFFTFYGYMTDSQNGRLPVGLIAQLVEHCTAIAEDPFIPEVFQALSLRLLSCVHNCDDQ